MHSIANLKCKEKEIQSQDIYHNCFSFSRISMTYVTCFVRQIYDQDRMPPINPTPNALAFLEVDCLFVKRYHLHTTILSTTQRSLKYLLSISQRLPYICSNISLLYYDLKRHKNVCLEDMSEYTNKYIFILRGPKQL